MDSKIVFRPFTESDIEIKIKWINDPCVNKYLHYDLPLEYDKTLNWYNRVKDLKTRADYVIEFEGNPVGLVGLLNIDYDKKEAEYYLTLGESDFRGRGYARRVIQLFLAKVIEEFSLNVVWMSTEKENAACKHIHEQLGFRLISKESDRYREISDSVDVYEISSSEVSL